MAYQVRFDHPFFARSVERCKKGAKHRRPMEDVQQILPLLEKRPLSQTVLKQVDDYKVCKVRVDDSTLAKGKSSGYRLVYAVASKEPTVICLFLYHKTHLKDVNVGMLLKEIRAQTDDQDDPFSVCPPNGSALTDA